MPNVLQTTNHPITHIHQVPPSDVETFRQLAGAFLILRKNHIPVTPTSLKDRFLELHEAHTSESRIRDLAASITAITANIIEQPEISDNLLSILAADSIAHAQYYQKIANDCFHGNGALLRYYLDLSPHLSLDLHPLIRDQKLLLSLLAHPEKIQLIKEHMTIARDFFQTLRTPEEHFMSEARVCQYALKLLAEGLHPKKSDFVEKLQLYVDDNRRFQSRRILEIHKEAQAAFPSNQSKRTDKIHQATTEHATRAAITAFDGPVFNGSFSEEKMAKYLKDPLCVRDSIETH